MARFLALLELFREGAVAFEQLTPLGELTVRWTGSDAGELDISDEFDEPATGAHDAMTTRRVARAGVDASRWTVGGEMAALEALLLLAVEPMSETELAQALGVPRVRWSPTTLAELVAFYDETGRGFELRQLGGGWRYYTREEHAELISRATCSRASRPSCPRPRWRPWR